MSRLVLVPLFVLLAAGLVGQSLRIDYFTVNDGLSTREINDLHLGRDGFLWVATMDGLNRFDGQRFVRVGEPRAGSPGLSRNAVASIAEDNEGRYVLTFADFYGYFDRFDPRDLSVEQVRLAPSTGVIGYPRAITTDTLGRTFVVTIGTGGTYLYEYTPNAGAGRRLFTPIYQDSTDAWASLTPRVELLAHSNGHFLLYDDEHGFRHLSATGQLLGRPLADRAGLKRFYTFAEAADGRVYLSFRGGIPLYTWRPDGLRDPVPVNTDNSGLRYPRIFRDGRGQLLLPGTEDILGDLHPSEYALVDTGGNFGWFDKPMPVNRQVDPVAALDFRETVYFGLREGLGVIERYDNPVATYLQQRPTDLFPNRMRGITEDRHGTVYFLEEDGALYAYRPGATRLDTLRLTDAEDTTRTVAFRAGTDLIYDPVEHRLWGGGQPTGMTRGGLLFSYDIATGTALACRTPYAPQALALGANGGLYVAVTDPRHVGLLLQLDRNRRICQPVTDGSSGDPLVRGVRINTLYPLRDGRLLLGTTGRGLLAFDPADTSVSPVPLRVVTDRNEDDKGAGAGAVGVQPAVYAVVEDAAGDWWIGSDTGLLHLRRATGDCRRYDRRAGLSHNEVVGVVPDSTGGFWLSTRNGLVHLPTDRQAGSVRRYFREDGLANDEFLPLSYHRDATGRYYFGGTNGLTAFRERDLDRATAGSRVMLTGVTVYGRTTERTILTDLDELRLVTVFAKEKSIAVSFALPAGRLPGGRRFRYRLEGFNDEWVPLVNEQTIRFNNLPSGRYMLRIQGAGANGNFGGGERKLAIHVRQYLIEQLGTQIFLVLAFGGLILYIIHGRYQERLRNEQFRTQLSADIHDEVSGLLAGITLQTELLKGRIEDEKTRSRLDAVGNAGRTAMSKLSDVIWSIDSRRDTIGDLLQRMQEHADELLLPLDIRYDFRADGLNHDAKLPGTVRQDLYFIFKEAINNIARHSLATRVSIRLTQFGQQFELYVRNDAPPPATRATSPGTRVRAHTRREKTGQGKDNMQMRAARLNGTLSIEEDDGYTVRFRMRRLD